VVNISAWIIIGAANTAAPCILFKLLLNFSFCINTNGSTGTVYVLVQVTLQHQYIGGTLPVAPTGEETSVANSRQSFPASPAEKFGC
jgi:hypothetical protein